MKDIARQLTAHPRWRWVPGMRALYPGGAWHRVTDGDYAYGIPPVYRPPNPRDAYPDLADPATVGCIASVVREVWGDESLHLIPLLDDTGLAWETDSDAYHREAMGGPNHTTPYRWGRTQGETWAYALLAHKEES